MSEIIHGDMTSVIDRINFATSTLNCPAQYAFTMEAVDEFDQETPTCMVYPAEQFSSQAGDSPTCRQMTSPSIAVISVASVEDMPNVLKDVRTALLGWSPGTYYADLRFTHRNKPFGEPMDIRASYLWWLDMYETDYLYRTT